MLPDVTSLPREQQLQLQNEILTRQLQQAMNGRATLSMQILALLIDAMAFSLQNATNPAVDISMPARKDLAILKSLIEKVLEGDWGGAPNAASRIIRPR